MKAPEKLGGKGTRARWIHPDYEWLADQHLERRKSAKQIAREIGVSKTTLIKWLREVGIQVQPSEGERHYLWAGGSLRRAHYKAKRALRRADVPEKCVWCGQSQDRTGHRAVVELHHKDHDPQNNVPDNLMWLCRTCHRLETAAWALLKRDKIDLACEGRTMVITFK